VSKEKDFDLSRFSGILDRPFTIELSVTILFSDITESLVELVVFNILVIVESYVSESLFLSM